MRDYGGNISCPNCGHLHYITPKQLQADVEIAFTCANCGTAAVYANSVAAEITSRLAAIGKGLGKIRL